MEESKKNLALIEKRLMADVGIDFKKNIEIACSWLRYAQDPAVQKPEADFINQEFLPNIIKILVSRKFDVPEDDQRAIMMILHLAVGILTARMGFDEIAHSSLEVLFNPFQPLFLKLNAFKGSQNYVPSTSYHQLMSNLAEGSCIDCLVNNIWQVGVVERFSEFRTEFEVALVNGPKLWMSLERDNHRIAPFGSKTSAETAISSSQNQENFIERNDERLVKGKPFVGCLIDAQDIAGTWYQACVLDNMIKMEKIEKKSERVEEIIDFNRPADSVEGDSTPPNPVASPAPSSEMQEVTYVRVAFIGLPSTCDEWISMQSCRLARLNTMSMGRHGDLRVREEVFFLSLNYAEEKEPPGGNFSRQYSNSFASKAFVVLVNHFGELDGPKYILYYLQKMAREKPTDYIIKGLPLINVVGQMHRVIHKINYRAFLTDALKGSYHLLYSMDPTEIRQTPVEAIETALCHIESIAFAIYGRSKEASNFVEKIRLRMGINYFISPFLNRRLGGLKLIVDMLKRSENALLYADGICVRSGSSGYDNATYVVVPVNFTHTARMICEELTKFGILEQLYFDNSIHESLVVRSGGILKSYAEEELLTEADIHRLVTISLAKGSPLQTVLIEVAGSFTPSDMKMMLLEIHKQDLSMLSEGLVSIVFSVALSCRKELMSSNSHLKEDQSSSLSVYHEVHTLATEELWLFASDASSASSNVKAFCVEKIELLIDLGISQTAALEDKYFPWAMQWYRMQHLIVKAVDSLNQFSSLVLAVKVLQSFLFSWPSKKPTVFESETSSVPFQPMRFAAADFIAHKYSAYDVVVQCIERLKCGTPSDNSEKVYSQELELLLDFLHNLFRSSEKSNLPKQALYSLWDLLVLHARQVEEFDLAINLFGKIPTKIVENVDVSSHIDTNVSESSRQQCMDIFLQLICDKENKGLFKSSFFSTSTLRVVEKWFRWINAELAFLEESKDGKILSVKAEISRLVGMDIFLSMIFRCNCNDVASGCVNFLIGLLQVADDSLSADYRETLLSYCLQHVNVMQESVELQRILLLLNGLVEESYATSATKLYAHSAMTSAGKKITFKISTTSKKLKQYIGELTLSYNNTVEDLVDQVSQMMHTSSQEIKIFRLGRELLQSDYRKSIGQLSMLNDKETIVVVERFQPAKASATPSISREVNGKSRNVAILLVTSEESKQSLFSLLEKAPSSEVRNVWKTISQLPTFFHTLIEWLQLLKATVSESVFPLTIQNGSRIGEIVYYLQIIDMFFSRSMPIEALLSQYGNGSVNSLSYPLNGDWIEHFLAKKGFDFLCEVYEWTCTIFSLFTKSPLSGVNTDLCILSLSLSGKLIRELLNAHMQSSRIYRVTISRLESRVDDIVRKSSKSSGDESSVIDLTGTDVVDESATKNNGMSKTEGPGNLAKAHKIATQINYAGWNSLFWYAISSPFLLQTALTLQLEESSIGSSLGYEQQLEDALKDALFIYVSCSLLSPMLLANKEYYDRSGVLVSSYDTLLAKIITLKSSDSAAVKMFSHWHVESLLLFLDIIEHHFQENKISLYQQLAVDLQSFLIDWLISNRPSISLRETGEQKDYDSLFLLWTKMTEMRKIDVLIGVDIINADKRYTACKSIFQEIFHIVEATKGLNTRPNVYNLTGNLQLLASLVKTEERLVLGYFDDNVVKYLIQDVLGVVDVHSCVRSSIIESSEIRSYLYQALSHVLVNNTDLSRSIYNHLKDVHSSIPKPFGFDVSFEKESRCRTGFSGLRNLGNTCYMNSLLQMLFMMPKIRSTLLQPNYFDLSLFSPKDLETSTIYQLQTVFKHLRHSAKKYYNPYNFMKIINEEYNVQQDACEYFLLLCERFEQGVHDIKQRKASGGDGQMVDVFQSTFGGKLCNQMFVFPSKISNANDPAVAPQLDASIKQHGIREQEENFNVISLDVKNCGNLLNSLQQFIKYEIINDFCWEENKGRVNILKRQCISSLSETVIFHLKRFELNFDTFIREKVNDAFEFPNTINLFPFTKMGLRHDTIENENFIYDLCGVVVHTGTSDSGHYFAYLRDTDSFVSSDEQQSEKWFEFNDAEVRDFNAANLGPECFGGTTTSHDYIPSTQSIVKTELVNPKNAYMLVYTRKRNIDFTEMPQSNSQSDTIDPVLERILHENASHTLSLRTLNRSHLTFYESIVRTLLSCSKRPENISTPSIIIESVQFLSYYVAHTPYVSIYQHLFDVVIEYVSDHDAKIIKKIQENREKNDVIGKVERGSEGNNGDLNVQTLPPAPTAMNTTSAADVPTGPTFELMPPLPPSCGALIGPASNDANCKIVRTEVDDSSALSIQLLKVVNNNFAEVVISYLIQCNNDTMRGTINQSLLGLLKLAWDVESSSNAASGSSPSPCGSMFAKITRYGNMSDFKIGALSDSQVEAELIVDDNGNSADAELALAIKLSQDTVIAPSTEKVEVKKEGSRGVRSNPFFQSLQCESFVFLFELTQDHNLNFLAEYWRKSNTYLQILLGLAKMDRCYRILLIFRDVIAQCVDIVLGEQSPLCNKLYVNNNSRKRAPSSYLNSANNSNNSKLVLKNIPDWSDLLALLSILVPECHIERDFRSKDDMELVFISEWDLIALTSKTFYSTLIKQVRYATAFKDLTTCLGRDNGKFTTMICEAVYEELSMTAAENIYYIFDIIHALISVTDSLTSRRLSILFGRSSTNLLDVMKNFAAQGIKSYAVLAFIRSFLTLFMQYSDAFNTLLCTPQSNIYFWAKWMTQFLFKNMSMAVSGEGVSTQVKSTGPAVFVYGEDEEEKYLTWQSRYEKTFNLLSTMLLSWDIDASALALDNIAESKLNTPVIIAQPHVPSTATVMAANSVVNKSVGSDSKQVVQLSDGMTDEELARYLESQF